MPTKPNKQETQFLLSLRDNPAEFAAGILQARWWSKQVEIANAVRDYSRVAVKACHSSGKTKCVADIALWFMTTHPPAVLISTAPGARQVNDLLWREMRRSYHAARYPLGGDFYEGSARWNLDDNWYAVGFTARDPDAFQGPHGANIMMIVDEAAGVSEPIFEAIEGIISTRNAKLILIGNPTSQSGTFHDAFTSARGYYHCITISAKDTPNFTGEGARRPYLITPDWAAGIEQRYGRDSAMYQSRVLGEFPMQGTDTLIPLQWLVDAQERWYDMPDTGTPVEIGVDVSYFGSDDTVVATRLGPKVLPLDVYHGQDTMTTVGRVIEAHRLHPTTATKIDMIGWGAGVYDRLAELEVYHAVAIDSAEAALDRGQYANLRAEMWFGLRNLLQQGMVGLPPDEELIGQLASVKYHPNSSGQLVLESKEDMRKRGLKSPDKADAVVYAFANVYGAPMANVEQDTEPSKWTDWGGGKSRWR